MAKKQTKPKKKIDSDNKKYEGNIYDKIFKEDAKAIFMPLIERRLGIKIKIFKPYKAKIQTTLEREMDFFYEIETEDSEIFLLHIEFQTENEPDMLYRKSEYHGIALNLKKMEIRHIVIYLGTYKPTMPTQLPENQVYRGFDLINIHAFDHTELLQSQVPDVIILAILADYPPEKAESILRLIVRQLKAFCQNKSELSKYIKQLVFLSRLRKIEGLTIKIAQEMPITYDIDTDALYKIGVEKGHELGTEKGIEKGIEKAIINLYKKGMTAETIADYMEYPISNVKQIITDYLLKGQK